MQLGVHSEIGKLRKVMVSRPSLAHERLTPGNCHDLLFDDVIWVQKARSDHADFVLKMKDRGIEVFDIQDLLTDDLPRQPRGAGLRARPADHRQPGRTGAGARAPALARRTRPASAGAAPARRRRLRGSAGRDDHAADARCAVGDRVHREAGAERALPARPVLLDLRRRHLQPDVLGGAQARVAVPARGLQVPPRVHRERVRDLVGRQRRGLGQHLDGGRRRHADRQGRRADRHGRAHDPAGGEPGRRPPVREGRAPSGSIACAMPKSGRRCTSTPSSPASTTTR